MKNVIQKKWAMFAKSFTLLVALMAQTAIGFSAPPVNDCTCPAPTNIVKTSQSTTAVSFAWDAADGASSYDVWYVRVDDDSTGPVTNTGSTSVSFTGLPAGRYVFYLITVCDGGTSSFIILDDLLMG